MKTETYVKESFCVIGKEGSTQDGAGFVQRLWAEANKCFEEVRPLAKQHPDGKLAGIWGLMTDFSRSFQPWSDGFSQGLYLAGIECTDDALPPSGWTRWCVPGFEYLRVKCTGENTFSEMIAWMQENEIPLAGAVQDYTDPATGENYMLFPIRRIHRKI